MNYIYLDSKIYGTVLQLINYFISGVFDIDNTIVYYKKYDGLHVKNLKGIFKRHHIKAYPFLRYSEIDMQNGGVVFYLFNAQSNCRIVANRNLKHIFVTHGESNKVSSIKPIIRIYDYVVTAGQLGINRYLNNRIFYEDDVSRGRLITMGDTFIGCNNYYYDNKSHTILYAPTWEGGLPSEDYSSLGLNDVFQKIYYYMQNLDRDTIVIQPHPNLGHRLPQYVKNMYNGIKWLLKREIKVVLIKDDKNIKDILLCLLCGKNFCLKSRYEKIAIKEGFCDISAMEAQLLTKKIPVKIFIKKEHANFEDKILNEYYKNSGIFENDMIIKTDNVFNRQMYDYLFDCNEKEIKKLPMEKRVEWLLSYIEKVENQMNKKNRE
jgi:hypothetical protein